jgi:hypothetical protein
LLTARLTALVGAAVAIVAIAAGCGDDDDSDSAGSAANGTASEARQDSGGNSEPESSAENGSSGSESISTSSLSEEQFVKQANAVCLREKNNYSAEVTAALKSPTLKGLSEREVGQKVVKTVVLPITEAQIAAILELGAPEGEEEEIEAALNAQQEAADEVRATKQAPPAEDLNSYFDEATEMLQDYGLTECVFSP